MAWEIFTKESKVRSTAPVLTIGKKLGRCTLNRAAAMLFDKEPVEYVLILWDKEKRKVGLRPIGKKDPRAFAIRYLRSKDKDHAVVAAAFSGVTFLHHIGYDLSTTKSYPIKWNEGESIFEVDIPAEKLSGSQPLYAVEGGKRHGKGAAG